MRYIATILSLMAIAATSLSEERDSPATQAQDLGSREATQTLIDMTATGPLLIENLDTILETPPGGVDAYDNAVLAEKCERRFLSEAIWGIIEKKGTLTEIARDARMQSLCWVAECNKRMLFDQPEVRSQQRERILAVVKDRLERTSEADKVRGFLDAAYRTTFYGASIVPHDGGNAVIDLFKDYVPDTDPIVHDFACSRLRFMGYVWHSRYDEILQHLIQEAPELRAVLTAKRVVGIDVDNLLGFKPEETYSERQYLAIDTASPEELAAIVESKLQGPPVYAPLATHAFAKLIQDACRPGGETALSAVVDFVRKRIMVGDVLYDVADNAMKTHSPADQQAAKNSFNEVLRVYENLPEPENQARFDVLESIQREIETKYRDQPKSPAREYVLQKLEETIERLKVKEAVTITIR